MAPGSHMGVLPTAVGGSESSLVEVGKSAVEDGVSGYR